MQNEQPIYSAQHSRSFFQRINVAIAAAVVVLGAIGLQPVLLILGIGIGGLYWFTTAQKYYVFADKLVIHYGRPRILEIPLDIIRDAGIVKIPLSAGVFIRRAGKSGVIIRPRKMEEFITQLWDAIQKNGGPAPEVLPPDAEPPAGE